MQLQRERHTEPELALRRVLHASGLRYRLHRRVIPGLRRELDIVFPSAKVAVDVRGCFWHACPLHATYPKVNADWWAEKLARNAARDRDTEARLAAAGWELIVAWEHDDPHRLATRVKRSVTRRRSKDASALGLGS